LVGKTTLVEAFGIVSKAKFMLSEDSGLLHIAWALKIPTVALIGSTDKNRSSQKGSHILTFNSDDMPCGNCMQATCQFGEIAPCMSRYSPEMLLETMKNFIENDSKKNSNYH
jgi:ADP-heptose:LPS heptosyltransferase